MKLFINVLVVFMLGIFTTVGLQAAPTTPDQAVHSYAYTVPDYGPTVLVATIDIPSNGTVIDYSYTMQNYTNFSKLVAHKDPGIRRTSNSILVEDDDWYRIHYIDKCTNIKLNKSNIDYLNYRC